jgi:hypothetical protein
MNLIETITKFINEYRSEVTGPRACKYTLVIEYQIIPGNTLGVNRIELTSHSPYPQQEERK